MRVRRLTLTSLASLCTLVGVLAWWGAPAQAAIIHDFLPAPSEEISKGVPAGAKAAGGEEALSGPVGGESYYSMTVAPGETPGEPGHLWVTGRKGVNEFNASSGKWELQLEHIGDGYGYDEVYGVAAGLSTGEREVYVTAGETVAVFGLAGKLQATWTGADTPGGSFKGYASGLAVDSSTSALDEHEGDVYVGTSGGVVDVFEPQAGGKEKYVTQLTGTCPIEGTVVGAATCEGEEIVPFGSGEEREVRVAVDPANGDVLVADGSAVDIFKSTVLDQYEFVRQITGVPGHSFAPHPIASVTAGGGEGDGDFYISEGQYFSAGVVVYEFSSEGVYLGSLTETPAGSFHDVVSETVDPASGDVYVGDNRGEASAGGVDVFGPDLVIPDVKTGAPSEVTPYSATLNGTVNPLKEGKVSCRFVWGTSEAFGQPPALCSEEVTEGDVPVPVRSKVLEGLVPDTRYFYRLQATNKNGTNTGVGTEAECEGKPAPVACFTTLGPGIHEESASNVASTSATLNATIDPNKAPTTYYFQYGTTSGYGTDVPAPPGAPIGSGEDDVEVTPHHLQGLQAGTVYHYHVVAISEVEVEPGVFKTEEFEGPDETFTTQTAGGFALPDGREWEMVSPPDKHGALIEPVDSAVGTNGDVIEASLSGSALTYVTNGPTEAEPQGNENDVQVMSTRGPRGWESQDMAIPHEMATGASIGFGMEYRFFSEDLSLGVVQPFGGFTPSLSPEASEQTPFLHTDFVNGDPGGPCLTSCYRPLVTGAPGHENVPPGTVFGDEESGSCHLCDGPFFEGATPDASRVVLSSRVALTETPDEDGLYEWADGKLTLVSLLPKSQGGGAVAGSLGGLLNGEAARRAISDDGSRVFWTGDDGHLYIRDVAGGEAAKGETLQLDAVQGGTGSEPADAVFQVASSDGSRVFFTDRERLTSDSGEGGSGRPDLYECEIVEIAGGNLECRLSDLTPLSSESREQGDLQGAVLGASEDGSWVYFVADGVFAPGAVPGTCNGTQATSPPGATCNLYVRHDGTTKLVAVLSSEDYADWAGGGGESLQGLTARVSPDGHWLAFMSQRDLTGYVTRDAVSGQLDEEVYLYSAETGKLVCASCNPTGARPIGAAYGDTFDHLLVGGDRVWEQTTWLAANIPGWTPMSLSAARYQSRYLSDSGRLFFNSRDALVPQDVNGTWDVYEYEPPAVGSCSTSSATFSERSGGCVGLISSGTSDAESAFLDASESGDDVFFVTKSKLAPQDYDDALDVYDAHECTVQAPCFPAAPLSPPACTTGDACKPAPTPQPAIFGAPSSATFSGAGNIVPSGPAVGVTPKALTRAQRLAAALRACEKKPRKKRAACRVRARRRIDAGKQRVKRSSSSRSSGKGGK